MTIGPLLSVVQSTSTKSPSGSSRRSRRKANRGWRRKVLGKMVCRCRLVSHQAGRNVLVLIMFSAVLHAFSLLTLDSLVVSRMLRQAGNEAVGQMHDFSLIGINAAGPLKLAQTLIYVRSQAGGMR